MQVVEVKTECVTAAVLPRYPAIKEILFIESALLHQLCNIVG